MNEPVPLPEPELNIKGWMSYYTADQMRAYGDARAAEMKERCASLCEAHAGMRNTGAWVALTAAAERIRNMEQTT